MGLLKTRFQEGVLILVLEIKPISIILILHTVRQTDIVNFHFYHGRFWNPARKKFLLLVRQARYLDEIDALVEIGGSFKHY